MATKRPDLMAVVEAAYRTDLSAPAWLDGIVAAMAPIIDRGLGLISFTYDASNPSRFGMSDMVGTASDVLLGANRALHQTLTPALIRAAYLSKPVGVLSSIVEPEMVAAVVGASSIQQYGLRDSIAITAADPTGLGVCLCAPTREPARISRSAALRLGRLAAHLVAGMRLRRQLADASARDDAEAVLRPDGRLEHAEPVAQAPGCREALRAAAVAIDRARSAKRRAEPDEALAAWEGLVAGRWSLVDRFDSDGRRYVVARRNDPAAPTVPKLTPRERQVVAFAALGHPNKLIAYELGLAEASVGVYLAEASAKLGVSSRVELVHLCRAFGGGGGARPTDDCPPQVRASAGARRGR